MGGVFEQMPYSNFHNLNLDWVLERIQEMRIFLDTVPNRIDAIDKEIDILEKKVLSLEKFQNDYLAGKYIGKEIEALSKWVDENLVGLVSRIVTFVFFYLNDDGYFCADIPDSWDFMRFDTIVDTNSENYGCLTFSWM